MIEQSAREQPARRRRARLWRFGVLSTVVTYVVLVVGATPVAGAG
jgi:hypothetical protein